jgi:hypothetical protein
MARSNPDRKKLEIAHLTLDVADVAHFQRHALAVTRDASADALK